MKKLPTQYAENLFSAYFKMLREMPATPAEWPSVATVADYLKTENPPRREAYEVNPPDSPQERAERHLSTFFACGRSYCDALFSSENPDRNHPETRDHWNGFTAMFPGGPIMAKQLAKSFKL